VGAHPVKWASEKKEGQRAEPCDSVEATSSGEKGMLKSVYKRLRWW